MADQSDVRRIALSLPESSESEDRFAFLVQSSNRAKAFVWVWLERKAPKKPRVPQPDVIAIRVNRELDKQALLGLRDDKFFTEPHYNGFPAILVRLELVDDEELAELITNAWCCQAPRSVVKAFNATRE